MSRNMKQEGMSRREEIERSVHVRRPPRLEGVVKNAKLYSKKKKKRETNDALQK